MKRYAMAATFLLTCLAAVAAAAAATGDDAAPREVRLTLDQAIARARQTSAGLRALDADVRAANASIEVAQADRKPWADVSGSYTRRSSVPELSLTMPDGSSHVIFPDIHDWWRGRVEATYPVYSGGRLSALESAARGDADAAHDDRVTAGIDLDLEVTHAYWALVTAREAVRVLTESLKSYEAHLVDARNREKVGLAARNDVLAVEVDRDRAELDRIRASNSADLAVARLARLLDLAPDEVVVPVESLEPPAVAPLDLEPLVEDALAARPERRALEARIAAATSRVDVERAARRPQVGVVGGWDYANPNTRVLPLTADWNDTWDVGVGVSFRLYDGGHARAAEARQTARVDSLQERLQDLDRSIRLDVTSSVLAVGNAVAALPVTERGVESGRENVRVTRDRYREGLAPNSDLLDAEERLLRAELNRTETLAELRLALADLDRALGR